MTDDEPMTPEQTITHARLTAQKLGKVMLPEMIAALDEEIARRCQSAEVAVKTFGDDCWGWDEWGRRTCVMEAALAFLQRISDDPEARDYLVKRFRKEGYERVSMDGGSGREAAQAARSGA